jgi:hypothetical protein
LLGTVGPRHPCRSTGKYQLMFPCNFTITYIIVRCNFSVTMEITGNSEDAITDLSHAQASAPLQYIPISPHCSHTIGTQDQHLGFSSASDKAFFPTPHPSLPHYLSLELSKPWQHYFSHPIRVLFTTLTSRRIICIHTLFPLSKK